MHDALDALEAHLRLRGRRPRTIATYRASVEGMFAFLGRTSLLEPPERHDIERFLLRAREDGQPRSASARNQDLAALRAFATCAQTVLGWPIDPSAGIAFAREKRRTPTFLTAPELRRLFVVTSERAASPAERARDLALVAVLSQSGLRVHEASGLDVGQFDVASATLLSVKGKGGTELDVPLNASTLALLLAWLNARSTMARDDEQALFVSRRGTRFSIRSMEHLFVTLRAAMGTSKRLSPHALRHSCATLALLAGADLEAVSQLLRHTDLNVTRLYLHHIDERRRDAVRRLGSTVPAELLAIQSPTLSPQTTSVTRSDGFESTSRCEKHALFAPMAEDSKKPLVDQEDFGDVGVAA